ncbi:poly(R)-hydroxyalkanoic acid synthase subunit PhaE [Halorarius litoreus]|uniref:poly(R)-hydroxyalkanoic acid synthase subunit PhaE n=1 Tax=Halorarius litoreus TaxID=2962676 RepID=UPI0020CD94B6|nr:poly(R)-hydroxyalkanoic acid synthase subunit PhaE [Halorarius litoreus]
MSDTNDEPRNPWAQMVENMNEAVSRSVEQNMEAQSAFMESWSKQMADSMPEQDELGEAFESYNAAYRVWMDAADQTFERLTDAAEDKDVGTTEFRDIWLQSANEAFKEVMDTAAFAAMTGDAVEQMMELQADMEELTQDNLTRMGLPTREDVDEVGARLIELERRQHDVEQKLDRVIDLLEAE